MGAPATPWTPAPAPPRPPLLGSHRYDVAIVGAGLTGLSAALELVELDPDRRVVVVEADHVAAGASGRGTGLLGPRVGPALTTARRRYGDDVARAAHLWSTEAVRHVTDLVERHRIPCDLTPGTQLVVAADAAGAERQRREADAARALGLPITLLGRDELPRHARGARSGLRYGPAATLDPAALTTALAALAERRGVVVHERSPVRSVRGGLLATVATDRGEVAADDVVVAVNAFGVAPWAPPGVLGVLVQAGATGPLPPQALAELAGLRAEPLIGAGELSPYYRLTPDRRLVVGGGAVRRGALGSAAPAPEALRAAARALSPALRAVELESTWAGPVAMTRDGVPVIGQHPDDPRIHRAGGCNGHGLAVSAHNGAHLARWIVHGRQDPLSTALPWVRGSAPWIPGGRLAGRVLDRYLARLSSAADRPTAPLDGGVRA
ncbi:NAD(P)/FAD-dependent oxidoreductase [Actinosynnema pretiosum]|uniref:FAD-dependent oxidoreductase n=1 Tax=Actinosynnema pretiosum TaxID=42197 RepID=A0A290Z8B2_9PSEU|nr:FAD-binding oxidoreductase [Actinosynnema pretiosum]ATE55209.1 FAD-dependent oxidoreductase [Actinosynnema pretiosum]